jgi:hypothetical protein
MSALDVSAAKLTQSTAMDGEFKEDAFRWNLSPTIRI